ncbi:MAG: RNA polymerase [Pseudomonadota bacterium]
MTDDCPPAKNNVRKPSEWMREKPLGKALREKYQAVQDEEVPQRLLDTIERIRQAETAKKKK